MKDRGQRFNEILKQEIAMILRRRINDSRIGFISLTDVKVTSDLKLAKVFYSQIGSDEEKKLTRKALRTAKNFIKFEVGKVIQMKTVPDLIFIYDQTLEQGVHIVNKIKQLYESDL